MPVWLIVTAAGGIGAWLGGLSYTAVDNSTSPVSSPAAPAAPSLMTVLAYSGLAFAGLYAAKKILKV